MEKGGRRRRSETPLVFGETGGGLMALEPQHKTLVRCLGKSHVLSSQGSVLASPNFLDALLGKDRVEARPLQAPRQTPVGQTSGCLQLRPVFADIAAAPSAGPISSRRSTTASEQPMRDPPVKHSIHPDRPRYRYFANTQISNRTRIRVSSRISGSRSNARYRIFVVRTARSGTKVEYFD